MRENVRKTDEELSERVAARRRDQFAALLIAVGCDPRSGALVGAKQVAAALGVERHYLVNSLATQPKLGFILAITADSLTSINSVPPGCREFIAVTLPGSAAACRDIRATRNAETWTGQLSRFAWRETSR